MVFVGESMSPTYHNHEITFTEPFSGIPYAGEVVTMNVGGSTIVKRIAFTPGEQYYQIRIGKEWLDATAINLGRNPERFAKSIRKITVPKGFVYVLGDNEAVSMDSRAFGYVPIANILRKLVDQRENKSDYAATIYYHEKSVKPQTKFLAFAKTGIAD